MHFLEFCHNFLYITKGKQIKVVIFCDHTFIFFEVLQEKLSKIFQNFLISFILVHDINFDVLLLVVEFLVVFICSVFLFFFTFFYIVFDDVFFLIVIHVGLLDLGLKSDILQASRITTNQFTAFIMSSLSQLFEKRSKKEQPSALGQLFNSNNVQKYTNISQKEKVNQPVRLPPPPPKKDQPEDLQSTVFVGNVPLSHSHKDMKKIFSQYGKISKVWFRSVPVEQTKLKRKANIILKNYQDGADSKNAYIKFEQKEQAEKACAVNGLKVDEHTLRVSLCLDDNLDYETTAFVGNMPLDIKEEELRAHFETAGEIVNVRVVRDKTTRKGIGIGYVRFANKQEMFNALKSMNGSILKERPLRVKRAVEKSKREKKINRVVTKNFNKKGFTAPKDPKKIWKVSQKFKRKDNGGQSNNPQDKANSRKFHFKRKMIKK